MINEAKLEFWNARAPLGEIAGTNDFILKRLETALLVSRIESGASILDIGCGNGLALVQLGKERGCTGVGIDFSPEMIREAGKGISAAGLQTRIALRVGQVPGLPDGLGTFDYALTERCLINLERQEAQQASFVEIMSHVKVGGLFLMIEDSVQGLDRLNQWRQMLNLELMSAPWHNNFLDEKFVASWENDSFKLVEAVPVASTYYFLSRVVYARLAQDKGEELRYDSDINLLSLKLPNVGDFGAVRLWVWRREK